MRGEDRSYKTTPKLDRPRLVTCKLCDCIFHEGTVDGSYEHALCSHPNKNQYMLTSDCPLYHLDWVKKMSVTRK